MPDTVVTAPQETGRIPYFTQETLGAVGAWLERLRPLIENGTIPPLPTHTPAGAAALQAAAALPPVAAPLLSPPALALPETVRRGYRTAEEWAAVTADVQGSLQALQGASGAPLVDPARPRALLTERGFHLRSGRVLKLSEAVHTTEFPYLLRAGFKTILFNSYAAYQTTYEQIAQRAESDKDVETWLQLSRLGRPGRVDEDEEYPEVSVTGLAPTSVRNVKKGYILKITEEMIRFDKTNQITQIAADRGEAMREEIDNNFWGVMTTTGNYVKTSADNNVGNNTGTLAFSPINLIVALETLTTMKESRSGRFLGIMPDTLACGSGVYFQALQLIKSAKIQSGEDAASAAGGVGGVPDNNPLFNVVPNVIMSPQILRYNWLLGRKQKGCVYQEVDPLTLVDQNVANATNEGWFTRDVWRYKARTWYGVGMYDDRYWFLSDASTGPSWA